MSPRSRRGWGGDMPAPHVWLTLGYRAIRQGEGESVIEWDATPDYCFHAPSGPIVHGGMVTTLLDTAMGGACWSLLEEDESFLTADLRVESIAGGYDMEPFGPGAGRAILIAVRP